MPPPRRSIVVIRYPDTVERNREGMKCFGTHFYESVLHIDPRDVLGVWYTKERHELVGCIQPFTKWCPNGDRKFDMSWLALGLEAQTESQPRHVKFAIAISSRILKIIGTRYCPLLIVTRVPATLRRS